MQFKTVESQNLNLDTKFISGNRIEDIPNNTVTYFPNISILDLYYLLLARYKRNYRGQQNEIHTLELKEVK